MAKLTDGARGSSPQLAIEHKCRADARTDRDEQEVLDATCRPQNSLRETAQTHVMAQSRGNA